MDLDVKLEGIYVGELGPVKGIGIKGYQRDSQGSMALSARQ